MCPAVGRASDRRPVVAPVRVNDRAHSGLGEQRKVHRRHQNRLDLPLRQRVEGGNQRRQLSSFGRWIGDNGDRPIGPLQRRLDVGLAPGARDHDDLVGSTASKRSDNARDKGVSFDGQQRFWPSHARGAAGGEHDGANHRAAFSAKLSRDPSSSPVTYSPRISRLIGAASTLRI